MNSLDYFIIIPIYNGASHIEELYKHIPSSLHHRVLFIDDGSVDETANVLKSLNLKMIRHSENNGKGSALKTGMEYAKRNDASFCVTMDVDLQHPPGSLHDFVKSYEANTISIGYRYDRSTMPIHRKLSNFLTSLLVSIRTNEIIKDSQCGYRLIPKSMFGLSLKESGFQFESELLLKGCLLGYGVNHIHIPTIYNQADSAIHPMRDTFKFITLWFRSFFW